VFFFPFNGAHCNPHICEPQSAVHVIALIRSLLRR